MTSRLDADDARIVARFKRLGPQRDALAVALRAFRDDTGSLDRRAWALAFTSPEPDAILAVTAVTSLYEGLVTLARFARSYVLWLEQRGIDILGRGER